MSKKRVILGAPRAVTEPMEVFVVFQRSRDDGASVIEGICGDMNKADLVAGGTKAKLNLLAGSQWQQFSENAWTDGATDVYIKKYIVL